MEEEKTIEEEVEILVNTQQNTINTEQFKKVINLLGREILNRKQRKYELTKFKLVKYLVNQLEKSKQGDIVHRLKLNSSALECIQDIERTFDANQSFERRLIFINWESIMIDNFTQTPTKEFNKGFKEYVKNYNEIRKKCDTDSFLNTSIHSVIFSKINSEKYEISDFLDLLLDPEIKVYENYSFLKNSFVNIICKKYFGLLMRNEPEKKYSTKALPISEKNYVLVHEYEGVNGVEMFCFDLNVFINLNLCDTPIKLLGIKPSEAKDKTLSIYFSYFGTSLYSYLFHLKSKKKQLRDEQILFILKLVIKETLYLLERNFLVENLNPFNIFLYKNRLGVIPKSYFGESLMKKNNSSRKDEQIKNESNLSYSVGMIFLYLKNNENNRSSLDKKILETSEPSTRKFVESLLAKNEPLSLPAALKILENHS